MGFLSGVLEAVKDDDAVTTYDNYITKEEDKLKSVLKLVDSKIGSGRKGLAASVDAVREWLEGYGNKVTEKNNDITVPLETLINKIKQRKSAIEAFKSKEYDDDNQKILNLWLKDVNKLPMLPKDSTQKLKNVNPMLSGELTPHVNMVSQAVNTFVDNAKRDRNELENVNYTISEQLHELLGNVTKEANKKAGECITTLKIAFKGKIQHPITAVKSKLDGVLRSLDKWISEANIVLSAAIRKAELVHRNLENNKVAPISKNVNDITQARKAIGKANKQLETHMQSLDHWKTAAENVLENASLKCDAILKEVNEKSPDDPTTVISKQAKELQRKACMLRDAVQDAKIAVQKQVGAAYKALIDLEDALKKDLGQIKKDIKGGITKYMTNVVIKVVEALNTVDFKQPGKWNAGFTGGIKALTNASSGLETGMLKRWIETFEKPEALEDILFSLKYNIKNHNSKELPKVDDQNPLITALNMDLGSKVDAQLDAESGGEVKLEKLATSFKNGAKVNLIKAIDAFQNDALKSLTANTDIANIFDNRRKTFETPINKIQKRLVDITRFLRNEEDHSGVKCDLDDLKSSGFTGNGANAWRKAPGGESDSLLKIQRDVRIQNGLLPTYCASIDGAIAAIGVELLELRKKLKDSVNKKDIIERLTDLRDKGIFCDKPWNETTGLVKIYNDVFKIIGPQSNDSNLTKIIEEAEYFYSETIGQKVVDCIAGITSFLSDQVTDKIQNLKKAALTQFAERKSAELDELQKLVTQQKTEIQNIIEKDKASGLKGLLSKIKRTNANQQTLDRMANKDVSGLADILKVFLGDIMSYIEGEVGTPIDNLTTTPTPSSQLVAGLQSRTHDLLTHLHENNRTFTFDSGFRSHLHELTTHLSTFNPATFANPHHPQLLDALKQGMRGLVKEMEKAYVNRYDSEKVTWKVMKDQKATDELTDDAKRCAKVFMSCLPMLLNDLSKVKERCVERGEWSKLKINSHPKNKLGPFFKSCGYSVATDVPLQDGELQNSSTMKGEHIHKIVADIKTISSDEHVPQCRSPKKTHNFDMIDYIICLANHLHQYYTVNHYATFNATKHPSNINDMLQWLTGLPHSPVYLGLTTDGFSDLFEKSEDADAKKLVLGDIPIETEDDVTLDAYPEKITVAKLSGVLTEVCHHAEETLISFLGHGHSGGTYACEFNTNHAKLTYPSDPSKCLDLLFEVISRVYNQLFFLFKQCSYATKLGGWYDCWYGQGVGGSAWNCNTLQCPGQRGDQKAGQEHNQKCNQSCDQTAECGLKSPLQSFLEDGLPGFLPHPYSKSNCKPTCTAPGHFGKVCITPMGFNDISGMASRRQQGRHIMEVLNEFCGSETAPLSRLCGLLTCLLTRPPQTLGDMFAFYYNFFNGWYDPKNSPRFTHREAAFGIEVKKAHFEAPYDDPDGNSIFTRGHGIRHVPSDWFSLLCGDHSGSDCGRYLQPIGQNIWTVFSNNCADKYLSWVVYLTETFYDLLKMLYEDCNTNCGKETSKCNRTSCISSCPLKSEIKSATQSKSPSDAKYHSTDCKSIVTCKSTLPTFCKYGFVFDSPETLSGMHGDYKKKTCKEFCTALDNVLNEETQFQRTLAKLKCKTIPNFLFKIRFPFMTLTLALWLLSLLYLIHIMVIRLDLLHIKSHLHSPSSHRIAAQSLLAAGRVNKLGKVFYLQP